MIEIGEFPCSIFPVMSICTRFFAPKKQCSQCEFPKLSTL